jgi:hypothetical protein
MIDIYFIIVGLLTNNKIYQYLESNDKLDDIFNILFILNHQSLVKERLLKNLQYYGYLDFNGVITILKGIYLKSTCFDDLMKYFLN